MGKLSLFCSVVVLILTLSTSWANSAKNGRFQLLKQEMWVEGIGQNPINRLGEQPLSVEQIAQNLPQSSDKALPEELDYVLHKFANQY